MVPGTKVEIVVKYYLRQWHTIECQWLPTEKKTKTYPATVHWVRQDGSYQIVDKEGVKWEVNKDNNFIDRPRRRNEIWQGPVIVHEIITSMFVRPVS